MTDTVPQTGVPASGLRRRIRFIDLIVYGLVFIGPAAAVSIFGPLDAKSHGAVPVVYLVATVAMSFTAFSYALMSRHVPRAGSVFAYASVGIGPRTGFITGWMVMLDYLLIPSVAYLFTGIAMHSFLPVLPTWGWTALAVVCTTGFNLAGVRVAARVAAITVVAEVVVLGMVLVGAAWLLVHEGPTRGWLSPFTGVGGFSVAAVLSAVSVAVLSYLGFDAIATFAEETIGSSRLVGRATLTCLVIAGLLFAAQTYIGSVISPTSPQQLAAHPGTQGDAYYHLVGVQLAGWLSSLLAFVKAAGAAFSAMVGQAAASRILMDMGRDRRMPTAMATVHHRSGVPVVGVLVAAVFNVLIAVWAARQPNGLDLLVSVVSVGALCAFVLLHASVVGYFWVRRAGGARRVGAHVVAPVVGVAILAVVLVEASHVAQVVGAVWLVVGLVLTAVQHRRAPRTATTD
ncbi:MAG TPA: APC family permease [Segeticoccus sp.]|uniref:APC family permease n=1 Tax=Segeticoccus sp. TaxID=2706531 RepID=UPI002D80D538|nr:APC family permease [Segeticoccus sp.]HET8601131.1 APC family permease [Segeticoccus sp.]